MDCITEDEGVGAIEQKGADDKRIGDSQLVGLEGQISEYQSCGQQKNESSSDINEKDFNRHVLNGGNPSITEFYPSLPVVEGVNEDKTVSLDVIPETKIGEHLAQQGYHSVIQNDPISISKSEQNTVVNENVTMDISTNITGNVETSATTILCQNGNPISEHTIQVQGYFGAKVNSDEPCENPKATGTKSNLTSTITTRIKEKKTYTDVDIDDDEIEGKRNYSIEEKLKSHRYNKKYVRNLKGEDFSLKYLQEHGLETPILFQEKTGLGLRVPSQNFHVSDVKQCVGSRRMIDVMDVMTQKAMEMSMREWVQYFENPERERLLNVISLEFSHTKLENYVESPNFVRQIDWVDTVWPPHYKECQTESTNIIEKMKYPKVRKYCLMSVGGCYTDFHIDFGGTSVWYHILHGEKVFWLVPPTERNMDIYVNWVLSGKQGDAFLADLVDGCQRIELHAGYTFIIPSGWIHAVYTPKDSLVFGGNFIHSFNIINQIRVSEVEDKTHVPQKFRYPFYAETAWYVLARYVACVAGKSYVELPPEDKENDDKSQLSVFDEGSRSPSQYSVESVVMETKKPSSKDGNSQETHKLSKSVTIELTRIDDTTLKKSNIDEENIPRKRASPRKFSSDSCSSADTVIYDKPSDLEDSPKQENDSAKDEKSGRKKVKAETESNLVPVSKEKKWHHLTKHELKGLHELIKWIEDLPANKKGVPKDVIDPDAVIREAKQMLEDHKGDNQVLACTGEPILVWPPSKKKMKSKPKHGSKPKSSQKGSPSSTIRKRRTRCKKCEPCTRTDCGECNFCKDMKKYGGPGRMKQSCISRQCLAPVLPHTALCMICGDDTRVKGEVTDELVSTLMECGICWEIVHPKCLSQKYENLDNEGNINEDLPNSWECPKCCHDGKQGQLKPRTFKGCSIKKLGDGQLSSSSESLLDQDKPKSPETPGKRVITKQGSSDKDTVKEEPVDVEVDVKEEEKTSIKESTNSKPNTESKSKVAVKSTIGRPSLSPRKHLQSIINRKKNKSPLKGKSVIKSPVKKPKVDPAPSTIISETGNPLSTEPVITRSGRTVKRSPQLTDENVEADIPRKKQKRDENIEADSPRKRPRREGTASSQDGTGIHGYKGDFSNSDRSPAKCLRNRVHSTNDSLPGPSRSRKLSGFARKPLKFGRSKSASALRKSLQSRSQKKSKFKRTFTHVDSPRTVAPEKRTTSESQKQASSIIPKGKHGQQMKSKQDAVKSRKSLPFSDNDREISGPSHGNILPKEPMVVLERYVVRPGPAPPPPEHFRLKSGANECLGRELWLKIFSYLNSADLSRCLAVCKVWNWWCYHPSFWKVIDLSEERIVQAHLIGIVKRQPRSLNLNSVVMTQHQLLWLSARLPQLKYLSLVSCSWATVSALCFSTCPLLHTLDLSWMLNLTEEHFHDLLTPPTDRRPGMKAISRLHRLKTLAVTGTEITDNSIQTMVVHLSQLEVLDISYCTNITDQGIKHLTDPEGCLGNTLKYLNMSGCKRLTDEAVRHLVNCTGLKTVNIGRCSGISENIVRNFPNKSVKFIR